VRKKQTEELKPTIVDFATTTFTTATTEDNMKFSNLPTFPPRSGWLEMEDEDDYHVYEDIDLPPSATKLQSQKSNKIPRFEKFEMAPKPTKLLTAFRRSCSDSVSSRASRN